MLFGLVASSTGTASATASHPFREPGIVLPYPSDLLVSNQPLDSVTDPIQRLVLSAYRLPGGHVNAHGTYKPPATGLSPNSSKKYRFPTPRSRRRRLHISSHPKLSDHLEGLGSRWEEISFLDHGRDFLLLA